MYVFSQLLNPFLKDDFLLIGVNFYCFNPNNFSNLEFSEEPIEQKAKEAFRKLWKQVVGVREPSQQLKGKVVL